MKHLTNLGQMWPKYLLLATFAYITFNTPNVANFSSFEMEFRRKPKVLFNLDTTPDIKVSDSFKDYPELLNKRLKYFNELLQNFKSKRLAMNNKDKAFLQYNSGDFIYIISPLTSQLHTVLRKALIKHVGPIVIDPHFYLLMTLDEKLWELYSNMRD